MKTVLHDAEPQGMTRKSRVYLLGSGCVLLVFLLWGMVGTTLIGCTGDDDDDAVATATPAMTATPTETPIPSVTPTPTPWVGWGDEVVANKSGGDWIDLETNDNGELCLAYYKEGINLAYVTRNQNRQWSTETVVPGSQGNVYWDKSFVSTAIDNATNVYFAWMNINWDAILYNRYDVASAAWHSSQGSNVIWGYDYILHPDIIITPDGSRRFVCSQVEWGTGFNWDLGSGWNSSVNIPLWNEGGESKTPRLAMGPNGEVYLVLYDYFFYDGKDQIGFNEFNPESLTWSGWVVPAVMSYDTYPGWPNIFVASDGSIHLVWFNWHAGMGHDEVCYVMRDTSGNWQPHEIVTSGSTLIDEGYREYYPRVAVNENGVIMVVWATRTETDGKAYYSVKNPGGAWSAPALVTNSEDQHYPALTVHGEMFTLAWLDKRSGEVYALYANDYIP